MTRARTVLITAAGTATAANVIAALRASRRFDVRTVGVDQSQFAAGLYLADAWHIVPPTQDPAYGPRLLEICRKEQIDFIFPLHSSEIPYFARERVRLLDAGINLCVPAVEAADICVRKERFAEFLTEHGFPAPRTYASPDAVDRYPVFLKPRSGSSSSNTFKATDAEELRYLVARFPQSLIQEHIDWAELTVDCFVSSRGVLVGCVPRYRRSVKDGKSMVAETAPQELVIGEVGRLLATLGMRGPSNVQLFHHPEQGIRFIEVNPRLAAGGLPLATFVGTNIPELMLREAAGETLAERIPVCAGVTMIRYLTELFLDADGRVARL
jgi:carbamoyl-phosphate synthase large subunit